MGTALREDTEKVFEEEFGAISFDALLAEEKRDGTLVASCRRE